MRYDWILDVLTDLRTFAEGNGLASLAAQLDDTVIIAAAEIAQLGEGRLGGQSGGGLGGGAAGDGT